MRLVPIWISSAPDSAASAGQSTAIPAPSASAVPTTTGTTAAVSVFGLAASSQVAERRRGGGGGGAHGRRGNFLKSGFRRSTYALRPSWASSVM